MRERQIRSVGWPSIFQIRLIISSLCPFQSLLTSLNCDGATNLLTRGKEQFEYQTFVYL